jgi:hypothetical protein
VRLIGDLTPNYNNRNNFAWFFRAFMIILPQKPTKLDENMGRLIKWVLILCVFGFVALSVYACVGPFFGVKFDPMRSPVRQSIELNEI